MTLASSSPGTPSLRGVPRRPSARITCRAGSSNEDVWTAKWPLGRVTPVTLDPKRMLSCARRVRSWNVSSRSSFSYSPSLSGPRNGISSAWTSTSLRRG